MALIKIVSRMEKQRITLTKIFTKLELKQIDNSIKTKIQGLGRHKMAFSLIFTRAVVWFSWFLLCFRPRLEMGRHLQSLFYQKIVFLRFFWSFWRRWRHSICWPTTKKTKVWSCCCTTFPYRWNQTKSATTNKGKRQSITLSVFVLATFDSNVIQMSSHICSG